MAQAIAVLRHPKTVAEAVAPTQPENNEWLLAVEAKIHQFASALEVSNPLARTYTHTHTRTRTPAHAHMYIQLKFCAG